MRKEGEEEGRSRGSPPLHSGEQGDHSEGERREEREKQCFDVSPTKGQKDLVGEGYSGPSSVNFRVGERSDGSKEGVLKTKQP